ncbi:transposase [Fictibacillus nanhaiensis]|uniref:transposase n=1 Tax=Fictibacillus nanhaiensis TaxID=742169 RepID=UPI002E1F7D8A|nr:transposase [Fictibacillus nanhaiensis]
MKNIPRSPRIWYPDAVYHVTTRGNRREPLFYSHLDFHRYLKILSHCVKKHAVELFSYCLMTNHTHLQILCSKSPPGDFMKELNETYAMYFNKKYELTGHVFQGRYGAELIEDRSHLLDTSRYIHLNPVSADLVMYPLEYQWSSYRYYVTPSVCPFVHTTTLLEQFNHSKSQYRDFVESKITPVVEL